MEKSLLLMQDVKLMVDMALLSHPQSQTEDLKSTAEAQQAVRHINQLKNLRLICASQ